MKLNVLGHCLLLLQGAASASSSSGLLRGEKDLDSAAHQQKVDTCTTIQEIHEGVVGYGSEVLICGASVSKVGFLGFVANDETLLYGHSVASMMWITHGPEATDLTNGEVLCRPENIDENLNCLVPLFMPARDEIVDIRGYVQEIGEGEGGFFIHIISGDKAGSFAPIAHHSPKVVDSDNLRGGSLEKVSTFLTVDCLHC